MDKFLLTQKDVDRLLAWRDEHKDLVRRMPSPLKSVHVYNTDLNAHFKAFRNGKTITIYGYHNQHSLGKVSWEMHPSGYCIKTHEKLEVTPQGTTMDIQSLLTVYASLMAYMVYGKRDNVGELVCKEEQTALHSPRKKPHSKPKGYTYIFTQAVKNKPLGGHHASPRGIFGVRGHYRKYKNGNTIWIEAYKKGTGKSKSKTYKMDKEE